jgi:hypothetical protein
VLSLSFILSRASAAEVSANPVEDEIIATMIIVNERAGMQLSEEQISELRGIVKMSAKKRFVKCFFELLTQNFSARRETGRKNGRKTRLWTFRSRFRRWIV